MSRIMLEDSTFKVIVFPCGTVYTKILKPKKCKQSKKGHAADSFYIEVARDQKCLSRQKVGDRKIIHKRD